MKNVNTPYVIIHESEELSIRLFKENRGNIIIKKLNQNTHSFYVNKLLNESEISKNLNFSGVRKVFQIKNKESSPELWLEYIEGKTLATLSKKKKGNIFEFLKIAIGVVNILSNVHETNVIHNNINYDNIIVGSNGQITLIDFGIAFDLNGNIPNQEDFLNHIDLKYSSPEQTGRIKQKVDARSDLYSLGVVLYEMLSGKRLFNFSDKQDLINAHLLTIPEPISDVDKNIPKTISNIISKLIRKNKNDRYQSAKGLLIDLTKCYNQLKEKNIIKEFELDEVGYAENHRIPSTFIGRENQMEVLNEELASLLEKKKTLITISGYSGVGKTRLVKEFINFNKQKEFTFISGKFDQYNRGVPYSGIIESFSRWIDVVLTLEEKKKKELKSRIEVAVGNNGNLLIDLFPKMKFILGQQPTIPKVGHKENKFRLEQVVQNFIGAIATKNNPLILFIDDLQWADASSFELLNTILKSDKDYYCLVIGSFRDNELKIGNNLNKWIVDLKTEHVNHVKIYIEELSLDNIVNLVEKSLDISSDKLKVAIWLHHKTGGNVFFTLELINILYKQNFIKNQKLGTQKWSLSIEEINQLEAPDSIIDLIVAKISKIDQNNLELLKIGACIGKQFDTEVLNYVASTSSAEKSLLSSELDDYLVKSEGGDELLTSYYFVHDKVQEAVYSSLSEKEREHYHYLIGSYYRNQSGYEEINNMFSVARNWNIVNVSKLNEKEKRALIDINLEVGINSLNNVSSENAILYFDKALTLVGQTKGVRKELIEEVMFWSAKADYNNALFDSAEIKLKQLLQTTKSLHNKSEIAIILCQLMQSQGKWEEAVKVGLNILEEHHIQVDFPESELGAQINLNIEKATKLIKAQMKSSSKKTKPLTDTNQLTILKIMNVVVSPVYVIRPQLLPIILSKGVTHSIIHGLSKYSPEFYQIFGRLLLSQREIVIAKYLIDTGFALLEKIDVEEQKCNAIFSYLQNMYWFRPFNYNEKYVIKAFKAAVSVGNVIFGAYIYANDLFETEAKGENLDKLSEKIKEYSTYLERVNNLPMLLLRDTISALIDELKGENKNALDNLVHSPTFDGFDHGIHYFNVKRAWVALLHKRYEQAEHYLELSTKHIHGAFMQYSVIEHQYYSCLVLLKLHPHEVLEKESEKGRIFWDSYNNILFWTKNGSDNFLHLKLIIESELGRVKVLDLNQLASLYDEAIETSKENGFIQHAGLCCELAADCFQEKGLSRMSKSYNSEAVILFKKWGAKSVVRRLEKNRKLLNNNIEGDITKPQEYVNTNLDLRTVINASITLSKAVTLKSVLKSMMKIVAKSAGADRIYYLVNDHFNINKKEEKWVLQACVDSRNNKEEFLQNIDLEKINRGNDVSYKIMRYVTNTKLLLMIDDLSTDERFGLEESPVEGNKKSILCTPIEYQGKFHSIFYLENNVITGAFTPHKAQILNALSQLLAVSYDNIKLFSDLNSKINQLQEWKHVFEHAEWGIAVGDVEEELLKFINPAFAKMHGYELDEMIGKPIKDYYAPESLKEIPKYIQISNETGYCTFEAMRIHKDGFLFPAQIEISTVKDKKGKNLYRAAHLQDITKRKKDEQALIESEKKYKLLFELAQEGIWVFNKNFYTTFVNPSMAKMLGYSSEEMMDKHIYDFMDERGVETAKFIIERNDVEKKQQYDIELLHKNGKTVVVAMETASIVDENGEVKGTIVGMMNITTRKQMEKQLRDHEADLERRVFERTLEVEEKNVELTASNKQLIDTLDMLKSTQSQLVKSEKMASLGVLTAGIAHEINNPINFVYAGIYSLEDNFNDVKKVLNAYETIDSTNVTKKLAEIDVLKATLKYDKLLSLVEKSTINIKNGAERTTEIIKGLKSFSRADNDELITVNIHENLDDTLLLLNNQLKERITIKKAYGNIPDIACYPSKINQVLVNLVDNAFQSIDGLGTIEITTSKETKREIEYVKIAISDTGVGIKKEVIDYVFEPFFTTKEVGKGTGLGLSISHGIIEEHKGFIEVESVLGKGTTMKIYIPIKQ